MAPPAPRPLRPINTLRTARRPFVASRPFYLSSDDEEEVQVVEPSSAPPSAALVPILSTTGVDNEQQGGRATQPPIRDDEPQWYGGKDPERPDLSACWSLKAVRTTIQEWGRASGATLVQIRARKDSSVSDYVSATFACNHKGRDCGKGSCHTLDPDKRRAGKTKYACPIRQVPIQVRILCS